MYPSSINPPPPPPPTSHHVTVAFDKKNQAENNEK